MLRRSLVWAKSLRVGRTAATLVGIVLAVAVVVISHPDRIWGSLQHVNPLAVLAAVLVNVPVIALRLVRAHVFLRRLGYHLTFRSMIVIQLIGQTSSSLTPASGGDYLRAYLWRRHFEVPIRAGAAVVLFERLMSFFLMVAVALLLISSARHGALGWLGVIAGLLAVTLAPLVLERIPPELERWFLHRFRNGRLLERISGGALGMIDNLRQLMRSPLILIEGSALTLAIFTLSGTQVWLLLAGLGDEVQLPHAVAVYATSQVGGTLSTLPFGIGPMDALVVTVLAGYGVSVATSATVAILLRATATVPQALAGLIAYSAFGKSSALSPAATESMAEVE